MSETLDVVLIDAIERRSIEYFRFAESEATHEARLRALSMVRHDLTATRLDELFRSPEYQRGAGPEDYPFLKWAAETASQRHEAGIALMDLEEKFQAGQQRKLNVAEHVGRLVIQSINEKQFKGLHVRGGILETVRNEAKRAKIYGGKDLDTLRDTWRTFKGVVHLGMAITYLEDNRDQNWDVLDLAETFRSILSSSCPKGTREPYVSSTEQIKFHYGSRGWGPRFRDRGLPFFCE